MTMTRDLIEQNNIKREDLKEENLAVYEDFILYLRTDLRVDEHASEEILMDLLEHLLEGQKYGRTAADLFGDRPLEYADELIENLPREKKRNAGVFIFSQMLGLVGWFSLSYGLINLVIGLFTPMDNTASIGGMLSLLATVIAVSFAVVILLFKIIRSTLFQPKKRMSTGYLKAGAVGAAAFAIIISAAWLIPKFGPDFRLDWWLSAAFGLAFLALAKIFSISTKK